jgi:general secretion pathway protein K
MSARAQSDRERGAALVTVLVMLSVMAAFAVLVVEAANISLRRAANQSELAQARWYLLGAESFAAGKLEELERRNAVAPVDSSEWQGVPFTFPLDQGVMNVTLWDGGNCFNLNSLATRSEEGRLSASARGQLQLARLLDLIDLRDADARIVPALADWIDGDNRPVTGGAEDESYDRPETPYVTANGLIADISELRRVRGFTPEIVARLSQFACVRPTEAPSTFNPNTLKEEQAPLLAMAIGPALSTERAREVIRRRPRGGWLDLDAFFLELRAAGVEPNEPSRLQFSLTSSYYVMGARVVHRDSVESASTLLERRGPMRVVRRVYGAGAERPIL